jgi:hypothetical protein
VSGSAYVVAAALGFGLSAAELVGRYRDKPTRALGRGGAWTYVLINAAASAGALLLISRFGWDLGQAGNSVTTVRVLMAGLGAAVLFRSSLFIVKVGNDNVGEGSTVDHWRASGC